MSLFNVYQKSIFKIAKEQTMVVIRLSRGGAKKRPFYHLVVTDKRNRRDGRYIERVGYFNPMARGQEIKLNIELARIEHWQSKGAQLSDRVAKLVKDSLAAQKPAADESAA